jgi:hypothetical protein
VLLVSTLRRMSSASQTSVNRVMARAEPQPVRRAVVADHALGD